MRAGARVLAAGQSRHGPGSPPACRDEAASPGRHRAGDGGHAGARASCGRAVTRPVSGRLLKAQTVLWAVAGEVGARGCLTRPG